MPGRKRSAATAALVTLALGAAARPETTSVFTISGPPDEEIIVEADRMTYGWETLLLHLDGHVVARRGRGILRAASGTYDRASGLLTLTGGVLGVEGKDVLLADSAAIDLEARTADLKSAVLYLKDRPADPDAPKSGVNTLILHGQRIRQIQGGYIAEEVRMTPCDCAGEPDYELLAGTATLHGDRADLSGARLHFLGATIPLFPLSMPLTQRQSGLLAPAFGLAPTIGFAYTQPVFLTLGPSNDVTVTPGYFTGGSNDAHSSALGVRTVRGPVLGLEWRTAPVAGTSGTVGLDLFDDFDQRDARKTDPDRTLEGRGFGGVRGVAHLSERTEGSAGVIALQGTVATDVMALNDVEPGTLDRVQDFLRTDLGAWRASGPLSYGLDATFLQDMRITDVNNPDRRLFGSEALSTYQRMPALFAQLAPVVVGPGTVSVEASAVQFVSFAGVDPQERATGFGPTDRGTPGTLSKAGDLARAPALRLDLSPRAGFASPATFPIDLRLDLGGRVDGWLVEGFPDRDRTRAYGFIGGRAALPVERRFGGVLHRIEPAIEVRAISRSLRSGGAPFGDLADAGGAPYTAAPDAAQQGLAGGVPALRRAYDEIDFAAPSTGAVETAFSLLQSLWTKPRSRFVSFNLQQEALLWTQGGTKRVGEGSATYGLALGPFSSSGSIRFDWSQRAISAVGLGGNAHDARSDEIHAALSLLRGSSSERLRAGIDELFSAARLAAAAGDLAGGVSAGISAPLIFGLKGGYDFGRYIGPLRQDIPDWSHSFGVLYETSCHCAGLRLTVALPYKDGHLLGGPSIHLFIDLKSLGSFATF
ncbi:MAG: hypothetical protein LC689_15695 [Myxococcales bacterium]|nr:hypothetical protein [Myxococcales bacterium]